MIKVDSPRNTSSGNGSGVQAARLSSLFKLGDPRDPGRLRRRHVPGNDLDTRASLDPAHHLDRSCTIVDRAQLLLQPFQRLHHLLGFPSVELFEKFQRISHALGLQPELMHLAVAGIRPGRLRTTESSRPTASR